jgi:hypothetical protein
VDVKLGGNGPLGTVDAAGFSALHPTLRVVAGAAAGTIFIPGLRVVTIASDGVSSPFRFRMSAGGAGDTATVFLYGYGENAVDLDCPT